MSPATSAPEFQTGAVASGVAALLQAEAPIIERLTNGLEKEVLAFLALRPLHTVWMAGLVRDNGLVSSLNRGTFYACRNAAGEIEGIALVGHATLFEARTSRALAAFARLAQSHARAHVLMGEQERVAQFWQHYSRGGQTARVLNRVLLFELRWPIGVRRSVKGLRLATLEDLSLVMPAQAGMACVESGINPMQVDPVGFRLRCARRIEQGRVWVLIEDGELLFKADVLSETPEVIYLEGIYISAHERGQTCGLRCMSQLSRTLLARAASVCLLINERNKDAQAFYQRAGFQYQCAYETIFFERTG